jgi:hypothetical protein
MPQLQAVLFHGLEQGRQVVGGAAGEDKQEVQGGPAQGHGGEVGVGVRGWGEGTARARARASASARGWEGCSGAAAAAREGGHGGSGTEEGADEQLAEQAGEDVGGSAQGLGSLGVVLGKQGSQAQGIEGALIQPIQGAQHLLGVVHRVVGEVGEGLEGGGCTIRLQRHLPSKVLVGSREKGEALRHALTASPRSAA